MGCGDMVEFERNWGEVSGQRFLYVRPKSEISDEDWVRFFQAELDDYRHDVFLVLVDVVGVEDNIGFDGFSRIAELLKKLNVRRTRIAVLPANESYPFLVDLFDTIAGKRGLDLKVELFHQRETAEAWLGSQ